MKNRAHIWTGIFPALGMLVLIIDSKTALSGAKDGIILCINTIIPSLFPFIVLTVMFNSMLLGKNICMLRLIGKYCGVPKGAESLLLLGIIGGYPVGAQSIYQAFQTGQIKRSDARHMLGFCNNAGPAFIFGMVSSLFSSPVVAWVIWGIHILSALLVGICLHDKATDNCMIKPCEPLSITESLERSIRVTATICGWVILFRIMIAVCSRWFLWLLSIELQLVVCGLLELSNGCFVLQTVDSDALRFIFSCCFLAAGGLCVVMQTTSVAGELGIGTYIRGKVLQCGFSIIMATFAQNYLFPEGDRLHVPVIIVICTAVLCISIIVLQHRKKVVAILQPLMYNNIKTSTLR